MVNIEDIREYETTLEEARTNSKSGIISNDNIMNTYCVLNYMLQYCNSIQIYSGENRLFTKNGKEKLREIADSNSTNYLYGKTLYLLEAFLNDPLKKIQLICERKPAEMEEDMKKIIANRKNFSFKTLKESTRDFFDYHFMIGDFLIYRRETNDSNKNGVVKIAYNNEELDNCKILREAFETISNDALPA